MYRLTVSIAFSAGHRLLGYNGKCISPHGHSYVADVQLRGPDLDRLGMLYDFSGLKASAKSWIADNWDHAFLANDHDIELIEALRSVRDSRIFLFTNCNPTAENMARVLLENLRMVIGESVYGVSIWETAEQCASCEYSTA
ncbi:6-pyruvoyl trahydropterin synthase family protein [Nocardia brasiliensis]